MAQSCYMAIKWTNSASSATKTDIYCLVESKVVIDNTLISNKPSVSNLNFENKIFNQTKNTALLHHKLHNAQQ